MALGLSATVANEVMDAIGSGSALTVLAGITNSFVQLHTADPGAAGTTAVAGNATRKQISMGSSSGGAITNDTAIDWSTSEVDTSEDYTHVSLWDASTSGNFLASGTMTANAVTAGDEFTIPVGDLDVSITNVAA